MGASIESWYEAVPDLWRDRAQRVRELIMEASPVMREGWRYGVPFYDHRRWMCYLNIQKGQLVLGFVPGVHLLDPERLLERTAHKLIRHYRPPAPPMRMNEAALRRLINEAVRVSEELAAAQIKRPRRS